jgi:hypothetical protein
MKKYIVYRCRGRRYGERPEDCSPGFLGDREDSLKIIKQQQHLLLPVKDMTESINLNGLCRAIEIRREPTLRADLPAVLLPGLDVSKEDINERGGSHEPPSG